MRSWVYFDRLVLTDSPTVDLDVLAGTLGVQRKQLQGITEETLQGVA